LNKKSGETSTSNSITLVKKQGLDGKHVNEDTIEDLVQKDGG
jgi:hypothetical protein